MAYDKLKTETYEMSGGMNSKASPYVNSPNEFRSIVNMNFFTPGSLTKRPGSTDYAGATYIGASTTLQIIGGFQFDSINNNYFSIVEATANTLYVKDLTFSNATLFPSGVSNVIATGLSAPIDSVYSFVPYADKLFYANGNSYRRTSGFGFGQTLGFTNIFISPGGVTTIITSSFGESTMPFADFKNTLPIPNTFGEAYVFKGYTMIGGFTITINTHVTYMASVQGITTGSSLIPAFSPYSPDSYQAIEGGTPVPVPGLSGYFSFSLAYEDETGHIGPAGAAFGGSYLFNGITFSSVTINIIPDGYSSWPAAIAGGAQYIDVFMSLPDGKDRFLVSQFPIWRMAYLRSIGQTYIQIADIHGEATAFPPVSVNPLGTPEPFFLDLQNVKPRYLEIFNNQLFVSGLRGSITTYEDSQEEIGRYSKVTVEPQNQSTVYFSDINAPNSFLPENFIEFRTNDGDRITGLKSYAGSLIVSKQKSFHRLSGTDPTNFLVQEISTEYGCLSNQAMVVWTNKLWFLDEKGICEYNGANINIISNKVQPIFDTMNISAAIDFATATHYKQQNEVWFAIPTGSSTRNDTIIVFDYLTDTWTVYKNINPSYIFIAGGALPYKRPFIGGYSGTLRYMDPLNYSDAGSSISCVIETRFLADSGQTTERQYRRFYLNVDPIGSTQPISVNFRTDFGASNVLSRTMYQNPFQSRIDFGLPAKSIQAEIGHVSASLPFKVNGFAFESRYQRST